MPRATARGGAGSRRSLSSVPVVPAPHVLRDYAMLADGHRGVLVGPQGDCAWMCFPGWADPALFASLVGSSGQYLVQPSGRFVWGGSYEDGTLIWRSRWVTTDGIFESRDALAYPGAADRAILLRRLSALDAPGTMQVALHPKADFGRRRIGRWRRQDDCWQVRGQGVEVRWWGADEAEPREVEGDERLELSVTLEPGAERDLVLEFAVDGSEPDPERPDPADAAAWWQITEHAWASEVPEAAGVVAARDVRRSYAVLRGMTGPEGGTVAAATTSLPERADRNRNYDYRYVWVRDTCYVGRAGAALAGGERMLDDAVRWVAARLAEHGAQMAPAYLPGGADVPPVEFLDLAGYPGGTDVVGNRIRDQFQLDAFGEALSLFAAAAACDRLGAAGWEAARVAADAVESRWDEPDSGIWEIEPCWWVASRLSAVAGLRAICAAGAPPQWQQRYLAVADEILARAARRGLHPSGRWQRGPEDARVDASLLLAQVHGALAAGDPRSVATRRAVAADLGSDGYVYRYAPSPRPLGEDEGAFLICNFWMSLACLQAGEVLEGIRWFERARSSAGSPGLLTEEFDVDQHQLRGNLPQSFVHAMLINCAVAQGDATLG